MKMKTSRAKILIFTLVLLCRITSSIYGQATAGYIPPGTSVNFTPNELRVIENEMDTLAYLDFDGDWSNDVRILLSKGNPTLDGPNMVLFRSLGSKYSFCAEEDNPEKIVLYNLGDILCSSSAIWGTDSLFVAGCYGGWACTQDTSSVQDKFIGYKNNSTGEIGWIKVSMSLYSQQDQIPVTFTIHQMLVLFLGTAVDNTPELNFVDVVPNPTRDGRFTILSNSEIIGVEIFNLSGQCLTKYHGMQKEYFIPDGKGVFLVRAMDIEGNYLVRNILRL